MTKNDSLNNVEIDNRTFNLIANCFSNASYTIPTEAELLTYGYNIRDENGVICIKPISKLQAFQYWLTKKVRKANFFRG